MAAGGESALRLAYNNGAADRIAYGFARATAASTLETKVKRFGTVDARTSTRAESDPTRQLIDLNAKATRTQAMLRDTLEKGAAGYVETGIGSIFFSDDTTDTFGTILHEDLHWYNAWSEQSGTELCSTVLQYMSEPGGYSSVDALIADKVEAYRRAGQELTYGQAAEEVVADALRGVFDSEDSLRDFIRYEQKQAEQGGKQKTLADKAIGAIRELVDRLLQSVKEILVEQPNNRSARAAQKMCEEYKKIIREMYYGHAEQAMKNRDAAAAGDEKVLNFNTEGQKENAPKDGARYRLDAQERYDITKPYAEQVDDAVTGKMPGGDHDVLIGRTPDVLRKIGLSDLPLLMNQHEMNTNYYAFAEDAVAHNPKFRPAENDNYHGMKNSIKGLYEKISDPVAVITSETRPDSSVIVIVKMKDASGNQCMAAIQVDAHGHLNFERIDTNRTSSFYGKDHNRVIKGLLRNAIENYEKGEKSIFYINKKALRTVEGSGVQFPSGLNSVDGFVANIHSAGSPVKGKTVGQTMSIQFERWFGKSKAVTEAGRPLKLFHQTTADFTEFDTGKTGAGSTDEGTPNGIFLKPRRAGADVRAGSGRSGCGRPSRRL